MPTIDTSDSEAMVNVILDERAAALAAARQRIDVLEARLAAERAHTNRLLMARACDREVTGTLLETVERLYPHLDEAVFNNTDLEALRDRVEKLRARSDDLAEPLAALPG